MREEASYKPLIMQLQTLLPKCRLYVNDHKAFTATGYPKHINLGPGTADLVGWVQGQWLEVEVKKPGETQSKLQKDHEKLVTDDGGIYVVAYLSDRLDEVVKKVAADVLDKL